MKKVLVPLARGFEEIEAVTIIDVLRRAELSVVVASLEGGPVRGSHDISMATDAKLAGVWDEHGPFDAVVLPGGMPGAANLRDSVAVLEAVRRAHEQDRIVAAICAAPIVLEAAGVLEGRRVTAYPTFRAELTSARPVDDRVVEDGPVITGAGPGAALEFALALVSRLASPATADELGRAMLVAR